MLVFLLLEDICDYIETFVLSFSLFKVTLISSKIVIKLEPAVV
jgi:hypothetical protein